jgi:FtsP/CotA-like multicopper oxidase with cupredoxin domain
MDRRRFFTAAGKATAVSAATFSNAVSVQADGYRRCDQVHLKLSESDIDKWVQPLPFPPILPTRVVRQQSDVQDPPLGGGSQGIAPEFHWQYPGLAVQPAAGTEWALTQASNFRPGDIYRGTIDNHPAPLQFAELIVRAVVREIVPGWLTRLLCYGFTERDAGGRVLQQHFSTPGPTILARSGQPLVVRLRNEIDPTLMLDTSLHQHGGHTPAHSDGHPNFLVEPGSLPGDKCVHGIGIRDYYYPNPVPHEALQEPGTAASPLAWRPLSSWDYGEIQNTMWYHDHAEDITAHNALMGLAGYFFLQDDPIEENGHDVTGPGGWRRHLPQKQIPLVFRDLCLVPITQPDQIQPAVSAELQSADPQRGLFGEARIHFDPFDHNGTLGTIHLVNGAAYPRQAVRFERYWLRMLDASLARFYNIEFWVVHPQTRQRKRLVFHRFGKDSWLFDQAQQQSSVFLGMATRADVCLDFAQLKSDVFKGWGHSDGSYEVLVVSTLNQKDGRGPGHGDNQQTLADTPRGGAEDIREDRAAPLFLLKFVVSEQADDRRTWPLQNQQSGQDPEQLQPSLPMQQGTRLRRHVQLPVPDPERIYVREFNFERGRGAWQINKRFYDSCIANAVPQLWSTELWILRNRSGGWWHPIHLHLESHQHLFVRAKNHRGERITLCREGYDPRRFDPTLAEGLDAWQSESEQARWREAFQPPEGSDFHHDAAISDFDCSVWNLGIKHDTTILGPNTEVHVLMRFRTFEGPFVFHCHNLDHEDMRMMFQMDPRSGLALPDEHLKVRRQYWYFKSPCDDEHCCRES